MHQQSAPTWDYGAPPIPVTPPRPSSRGRCATCSAPVYDDQEAVHVAITWPTVSYPVPYRHTECQ